jgi:hypothetical protein
MEILRKLAIAALGAFFLATLAGGVWMLLLIAGIL